MLHHAQRGRLPPLRPPERPPGAVPALGERPPLGGASRGARGRLPARGAGSPHPRGAPFREGLTLAAFGSVFLNRKGKRSWGGRDPAVRVPAGSRCRAPGEGPLDAGLRGEPRAGAAPGFTTVGLRKGRPREEDSGAALSFPPLLLDPCDIGIVTLKPQGQRSAS